MDQIVVKENIVLCLVLKTTRAGALQGDRLARERHGPELLALLRVRDHGRQRHGPHGQDLEHRARAED